MVTEMDKGKKKENKNRVKRQFIKIMDVQFYNTNPYNITHLYLHI